MRRVLVPLALLSAFAGASSILVGDFDFSARADLENQVFTSREHGLRIVIPRGWRATDQPSYPGFLVWLLRTQPAGTMVLTAEPLTHEKYCTWPVACRTSPDSLATKYACALRSKLVAQKLEVGPTQAGPKDNDAAGLPSVWFEYDDGATFLRQAVAVTDRRTVTLVLSSPTSDARASNVRSFEQTLRTLARIDTASSPAPTDASVPSDAGSASPAPSSAVTAVTAVPTFDPNVPCTTISTQR